MAVYLLKKKIYEFDGKLCRLRGRRNYLHGTDIFENIFKINKKKSLKEFNINFKDPIYNIPKILVQNKFSSKLKKKCSCYFEYKINNILQYGFIICSQKKIINIKIYEEHKIQNKVKIYRNKIIVPEIKNFNFIELVSASVMKYLKNISPELSSKWYFGKISLNLLNSRKFNLRKSLILKINKLSNLIYNFEIFSNDKKIGSLLFIKK